MTDARPNPGSDAAVAKGCRCPVVENARGFGVFLDEDGVPQFWVSANCPLHAPDVVQREDSPDA